MSDLSEPGALSRRGAREFIIPVRMNRFCLKGVAVLLEASIGGCVSARGVAGLDLRRVEKKGRRRSGEAEGGTSEAPIKVPHFSGCEVWGTDPRESALQVVGA